MTDKFQFGYLVRHKTTGRTAVIRYVDREAGTANLDYQGDRSFGLVALDELQLLGEHYAAAPRPLPLPCPFCGVTNMNIPVHETAGVECRDCGAQGPVVEWCSDDGVIAKATHWELLVGAWNKRAVPK